MCIIFFTHQESHPDDQAQDKLRVVEHDDTTHDDIVIVDNGLRLVCRIGWGLAPAEHWLRRIYEVRGYLHVACFVWHLQ